MPKSAKHVYNNKTYTLEDQQGYVFVDPQTKEVGSNQTYSIHDVGTLSKDASLNRGYIWAGGTKEIVPVSIQVTKRPIKVTANNYGATFGDQKQDNGVTYAKTEAAESGLADGETGLSNVSFAYSYGTYNRFVNHGNYNITPVIPSETPNNNYDVVTVSGSLTVNVKAITCE